MAIREWGWLGACQHFHNQAKYDSQHKTGDNGSRDRGEWVHDFFLRVRRGDSQVKSWAIIRASLIYARLLKAIDPNEILLGAGVIFKSAG